MDMLRAILPIAIQGSILLLVFAIGLQARWEEVTYGFRHPVLLIRGIAAINIVVPAFAAGLVAATPLDPVVKLAIVLMAVSPLPPFLPGKELRLGGRREHVLGLYVALSILSILIVPLTLALLSRLFPADAEIPVAAVARVIVATVLLPLAIGLVAARLAPTLASRAAPILSMIAGFLLGAAFLLILLATGRTMLALVGNGTILAMMAVVAVGLLAGHLLGGADRQDRAVLAIAAAARHPGIALMVARANFTEPRITAAILLFVIVGVVAAIPYQIWLKRRSLDPARAGNAE